MYFRDYERHIIVEKGGRFSDEEESDGDGEKPVEERSPGTYVEEQNKLKNEIINAFKPEDVNDEDDDLFTVKLLLLRSIS